ncbi:MAG: glycosyltransferase family 2 protein [Leptolyngbyaceae cyanobacterium bins.349]|nr:glycosyltransferase family 2 protein [Leptolyngbyaceae cyanobacterium bins.349]
MFITVVIPTYYRHKDLCRCLLALADQSRLADEIIVVVQSADLETRDLLKDLSFKELPIQVNLIDIPGQVAALNAALEVAKGDIIAFTDDDGKPHENWLKLIEHYFESDPLVGGVGGRDWCYNGTEFDSGMREVVGKIQWFGRIIGNHHLGAGTSREVDFLKGANMSFRRAAIAHLQFDERLRGTGAQPCNDIAFSLAVKRAGWKLIYDPAVAIDHYAVNPDNARSYVYTRETQAFDPKDLINFGYNFFLSFWEHLSQQSRLAFLGWFVLIGSKNSPGFVQAIRLTPNLGFLSWQRYIAFQKGLITAMYDSLVDKNF